MCCYGVVFRLAVMVVKVPSFFVVMVITMSLFFLVLIGLGDFLQFTVKILVGVFFQLMK